MARLSEVEKMLSELSRGEKAQVLQWITRDLEDDFPGIDARPSVSGGEACVVRTRIPVWVLVKARREGLSEEALLHAYPALGAEDLANAWGYARSHPAEIDRQIEANEAA